MAEHEIQDIPVPIKGGELITIRLQEKRRQTERGIEGIVYALLDPHTLQETGEYWAPIAQPPTP
ncbi:MAG: hypothetical protein ABSC06_37295 [Rhodopila sp.]|jgi:hypothetical protein